MSMIFGDIEIKVIVLDILFGKEVRVSINFLYLENICYLVVDCGGGIVDFIVYELDL